MTVKSVLSVLTLFLMMLPGVIMKRCKLATEGFGKGLSNLVLFIASPALVFEAYLRDFNADIMKTALIMFVCTICTHTLFALVAFRFFKREEENVRRILRFMIIFANAGYILHRKHRKELYRKSFHTAAPSEQPHASFAAPPEQ